MNSPINSEAGDPPFGTPREIVLQPYEFELTAEELGMGSARIIGEPGPDECEFISDPSLYSLYDPPKPATTRPGGRRRPPEIFRTTLLKELHPLIDCVNALGGPESWMLWTDTRPPIRRPIPPRAPASITGCAVTFYLQLREHSFARNQLLSTLLCVAKYGAAHDINGAPAGPAERRVGSLRSPLRLQLERRTDGSAAIDRVSWSQRLHVTCAETDRIKAIRRQVDMLCEHLTDRGNLLPLGHPSMLV